MPVPYTSTADEPICVVEAGLGIWASNLKKVADTQMKILGKRGSQSTDELEAKASSNLSSHQFQASRI